MYVRLRLDSMDTSSMNRTDHKDVELIKAPKRCLNSLPQRHDEAHGREGTLTTRQRLSVLGGLRMVTVTIHTDLMKELVDGRM